MCKSPHCINKRKKKVESAESIEQDILSTRVTIEEAFTSAKDVILESVYKHLIFNKNNPWLYNVIKSIRKWFKSTGKHNLLLVLVEEDKLEQVKEILGDVRIELNHISGDARTLKIEDKRRIKYKTVDGKLIRTFYLDGKLIEEEINNLNDLE